MVTTISSYPFPFSFLISNICELPDDTLRVTDAAILSLLLHVLAGSLVQFSFLYT